ncbi:hypothetical protein Scep_010665 [Stephania cephalantha]|uniref:NAD-dependent epimerase/dehydratase domain-containing protein n=1 Tax=Stephania cephalantha TaxID=152367 RepID=A0AAP0JW82_9MAGN
MRKLASRLACHPIRHSIPFSERAVPQDIEAGALQQLPPASEPHEPPRGLFQALVPLDALSGATSTILLRYQSPYNLTTFLPPAPPPLLPLLLLPRRPRLGETSPHLRRPRRPNGLSVLVTGAAGFVGTHCSLALKKRGDGVLGLDNFNSYYDVSLKRSRQSLLNRHRVFIVEADINDAQLLAKLFDIAPFSHVLHLAAQAGVRYALQNPLSYIQSNIAGFVSLLETCKSVNPQPSIVWASSSSVYGLNWKTPFSEDDTTDQPASLYAATKKSGEEIAHSYNHIYGLSLTALRFFTVYGPWGRPDMAYYFFTKDILNGKGITVYKTSDGEEVARDFTFIDDVVKGCLGALDTAEKSTGSGGGRGAKKRVVKMPSNGDVPFTHANVSLAYRDFGYKPTTDLGTGLKKFVKWYVGYYGVQSRAKRGSDQSAEE